ncbi:MAG: pentapeptide repeat-containing protein [Acidobacteria bacterium]|nr:pentapeptide repeat-containing protein [Acidobacteriota bacterium]
MTNHPSPSASNDRSGGTSGTGGRRLLSVFDRLLSQPAARWKSGAAAVAAIVAAGIGTMNQIESCAASRVEEARRQVREASEAPLNERRMLPLRNAVERLHNSGASLPADLRNFELSEAQLAGVSLKGAHASGIRFRGAHLVSADFSDATLRYSDFSGARLVGADFSRADVYASDFRDAEFGSAGSRKAVLPFGIACSNLSALDLSHLDLSERVFIFGSVANSDFAGADLSGASFLYTDVSQADFSGVTGLTEEFQLADACIRGARHPSLPDGVEWEGKTCNQFELQRSRECALR